MSSGIELTAGNFEDEVLKSDLPVLVDFWAEWCTPCKMISPLVDQLAVDFAGRVKVAKLNVDTEGELAGQYGIVSIPTLMVFKAGEVVKQKVGAVPKHELEKLLQDVL